MGFWGRRLAIRRDLRGISSHTPGWWSVDFRPRLGLCWLHLWERPDAFARGSDSGWPGRQVGLSSRRLVPGACGSGRY